MKKKKELKRKTPLTKILDGKRVNVCDYHGTCKNKAHKEVYPFLLKGKHRDKGWSYLCRKHFKHEKKRLNGKLYYCSID